MQMFFLYEYHNLVLAFKELKMSVTETYLLGLVESYSFSTWNNYTVKVQTKIPDFDPALQMVGNGFKPKK